MKIVDKITDLRLMLGAVKNRAQSVGLVPTMGNLHAGHLALVRRARQECDIVLGTIFVNPTQFGPNEDLSRYPRTFNEDVAALEGLHCDILFAPDVVEIYPGGPAPDTVVSPGDLSKLHCGASRPGHFEGVCTVVTKLFNISQPDKAYFGEKDYQQLTIIRKLVQDLNFPLEIVGVPTVREPSGLAMSSRNNYLTGEQKQQATVLYQCLSDCSTALQAGNSKDSADFAKLESSALRKMSDAGLKPDYFSICQAQTLLPATAADKEVVILAAAYLGDTRLIDNISLSLT